MATRKTTSPLLDSIKKRAWELRAEKLGVNHSQRLDLAAREKGFKSYRQSVKTDNKSQQAFSSGCQDINHSTISRSIPAKKYVSANAFRSHFITSQFYAHIRDRHLIKHYLEALIQIQRLNSNSTVEVDNLKALRKSKYVRELFTSPLRLKEQLYLIHLITGFKRISFSKFYIRKYVTTD